jgi:hypothetical protein
MTFKKVLATTLFLVTVSTSFAQNGWISGEIFLKNGASKTGLIKLSKVSKDLIAIGGDKVVRYKPAKKGKKKKYREPEIDHIILNDAGSTYNGFYEYVHVSETRKELFRAVLTGRAILYQRNVHMTSSSGGANGILMNTTYEVAEYYVLREGETLAKPLITGRISKSFRHRASIFFEDCPSLVIQIENKTYRKKDIEEVVRAYNNCEKIN